MAKHGSLSINSENIFPIIKKWMYSDHDIFARELVSNGCDAITKLKKLDVIGQYSIPDGKDMEIRIVVDPENKKVSFTDEEKKSALARIAQIRQKLNDGVAFEVLAADYNEDTKDEYSFGRGVMPREFEEAAFNLGVGEVSDIVETEYGYHLIYCVTTFNPEETDANKVKIVEKRKHEAFDEVYNNYVTGLTSNLNKPLFDSIHYDSGGVVKTTGFFDVYDKYFTVVSTQSD